MIGPASEGIPAMLYIIPVHCPSFEWLRWWVSSVLYVHFKMLAIEAGGSPITAPENMPKKTQKEIAADVDPVSVHRIKTSREETICVTICIFRGPVLSEKLAIVIRPMVEAPFIMVRSQNVCSASELGTTAFV